MLRGPHWYATPAELERFRDDAGELVAMIPTKQVERALDAVAGVNTLLGVGGMVQRRLVMDDRITAQKQALAGQKPAPQPPQPPRGTGSTNDGGQRPAEAPAAPQADGETARQETVPVTRLNGILAGT